MTEQAVAELKAYLEANVFHSDPNSFVILYGGSIYKKLSESDIDFAVVTTSYSQTLGRQLEKFIIELHEKYDLRIDTEVPFSNKLLYSKNDVEFALGLGCFTKKGQSYQIPPIKKTDEFLASPEVKARLILNAFTTPHEFWGNAEQGSAAEIKASIAVTVLAIGLIEDEVFSRAKLCRILAESEEGERGESYLGYKTQYDIVADYLEGCIVLGLSILSEAGYIESAGNGQWKRCHNYIASEALNLVIKVGA